MQKNAFRGKLEESNQPEDREIPFEMIKNSNAKEHKHFEMSKQEVVR
jgi:hypothetical protein